ncbi:VOC family protein [Streptomyces tsukubensis]|uniref:Glyoxalase-like domain-containing protein n=1 Tax=Streptomyces tsukubensis TaxID=83656 RepID=A0A1V4A9Q2_9ACTN|nr:VOC family protein [Streptomyces tsukubensis]OON80562.1 hypothetical protein B1H18_11755 [Streptomyces tsukubensis]QFR96214.1 VOC family protein [Streptomyces tsukubensis]
MIRWSWAFIDRPAHDAGRAVSFWSSVTGGRPSEPWGEQGEFTTLTPDGADASLAVQSVGGHGGVHPDLAVDDLAAHAERATELGAAVVAELPELTVLHSPGGLPFCLAPWRGQSRVQAVFGDPAGGFSRVDQICVDVAPSAFEGELTFWSALTGHAPTTGVHPEFRRIAAGVGLPVHFLIQRLTEERPTAAHLDLSCSDPEATRRYHEEQGATLVGHGAGWTVMHDPTGGTYCLTGRDPWTGA